MAAFQVTSSQLRAKASELRQMNRQFKSQLGNLDSQERSLNGMWEGDAKNAFEKAFRNDRVQMDNFYSLIEQYCTALENIASKYETAEQRNINTATTRTYR
jgi:WXG100 family type VII secretion target